jgi:hypothetical protein
MVGLIGTYLTGCGGDTTGPAPLDTSRAFWSLRLNYHAANLALTETANTVQLVAVPLNVHGDTLMSLGRVTYSAADSTVSVDSTGLVTANYRTKDVDSPTFVVASLQYQNLTLADTVFIQVTPTVPATLATFSMHPASGTSTSCSLNVSGTTLIQNCGPLVVDATDVNGDTLSSASKHSLLISYASSDPFLAIVSRTGVITEADTGHVVFTASTWAYGLLQKDSIQYIVGWPRFQGVYVKSVTPANSLTPVLTFVPAAIVLDVGGTVGWQNLRSEPIDVVFDDSTDVQAGCYYFLCNFFRFSGTGNIPPFYVNATGTDTSVFAVGLVARSFPVAGIYHYHSRLYPSSTGVIYVEDHLQ